MTDQAQSPQASSSESVKTAVPHHNPLVHAIARMNLTQLTLAVLVVIFLWQWFDAKHQMNQMEQTLAKRLAEADGSNKANQTMLMQNQEVVRELGGKLSLLENKYAETQNQRAALESLYQDLSSSRDQMVLAEVEQLLLIAGQQLQLSANVKAALIAMQQADNRLQRADRAALGALRGAINRDMDKLRVLPNVDVSGINARLDAMLAVVATLPLVQEAHTLDEVKATETVPAAGTWQRLLHEIWQDAKHLVRIENTRQTELPLLSPSQSFFVRENVKLRLLSARLALLAHDEAGFRRDIKTAQEWIRLYFDVKSAEGTQLLNTLQKLGVSSISIDLPDISGSLEAVRHYRAAHEKGAR